MRKIKNSAIAFAGLLLLAGAFGFVAPIAIHGQDHATQSDNMVAAQNVNVVNTASVRDADNSARLAYQDSAVATFSGGNYSSGIFFSPIPAGKRLVIEYVSVDVELPIGQTARADIVTHLGGKIAGHALVMNNQGIVAGSPTNRQDFVASQLVRFYEGSGSGPGINVSRSAATGDAVAIGSISGYLVDVP